MTPKSILQRCSVVLMIAASVAPTALHAFPIEKIPNPRKIEGNWVSDVANILRPETEQQLNTMIHQLQASNGSEIAIVTLPDSTPLSSPKELATRLFNLWGIGQKGKDNGLLFLVSVADRRVEIETGYGLEARLPDTKAGQIIEQQVTPAFKRGDFDQGTLSGTEAIVKVLQGKESDWNADPKSVIPLEVWPALIVFGAALVFVIGLWVGLLFPATSGRLTASLQGLAGLTLLRGLGQSVKLHPRQSSRAKAWHLNMETVGVMRCADCGGALEPVEDVAVEGVLTPKQKAAVKLRSLQFRGWRCRQCAPDSMHLRAYESTSELFAYCPRCQELTVIHEAPYVISNPAFLAPDLRITNSHCVNCDYTNQKKELINGWVVSNDDSSDGGGSSSSSGSDFSGGSSGGGGAGGNW